MTITTASIRTVSSNSIGNHMLCLEPMDLFISQKPVINAVKKLFGEKVQGVIMTSSARAHITLFRGWKSSPKFTNELQEELLHKIALGLTGIEPFETEISPQNANIKINNKYVFIEIDDAYLKSLQEKIQEITQQFIVENDLEIDDQWFDKEYSPHMTLAQIDGSFKESQFPYKSRRMREKNLQARIGLTKINVNRVSLINIRNRTFHNVGGVDLGDSLKFDEKCKQHLNQIAGSSSVVQIKSGAKRNENRNLIVTFGSKKAAINFIKNARIRKKYLRESLDFMPKKCFEVKLEEAKYQEIFNSDENNHSFKDLLVYYDERNN